MNLSGGKLNKIILVLVLFACNFSLLVMQPQTQHSYNYNSEKTNELKALLATIFDTSIFYPHILTDADKMKIKELILAGADPNVRAWGIFYACCNLLEALVSNEKNYYYHNDLSLFLLENGADPNSPRCYNQSPLGDVCNRSCVGAAARLIKYGANVHHKTLFGETPLFQAVKRYSKDIVKLLLVNGAACDIEMPDNTNETPFSFADKEDFPMHCKEDRDRTKSLLEEYRKKKLK